MSLDQTGHALVAFAAQSEWPLHGLARSNSALEIVADFGEIVGKDKGSTGTIRSMSNIDRLVRELRSRAQLGDFRIAPVSDLAKIDIGEDRTG